MTDLFEMSTGDRVEHQMMLDTFKGWDDEHALEIKKITQDWDSGRINAEQYRKACDVEDTRNQSRKDNREMEIMVSKFKRDNKSRAESLNNMPRMARSAKQKRTFMKVEGIKDAEWVKYGDDMITLLKKKHSGEVSAERYLHDVEQLQRHLEFTLKWIEETDGESHKRSLFRVLAEMWASR